MIRRLSQPGSPEALADIYQDDVNIAVWKRTLSPELLQAAELIVNSNHAFRFTGVITPEDTFDQLFDALGGLYKLIRHRLIKR